MVDPLEVPYTLSQLAFILGTSQIDILDWIEKGKLRAFKNGKVTAVKLIDLCDFLVQNRDLVSRLYFEEGLPWLNDVRQTVINEVESHDF